MKKRRHVALLIEASRGHGRQIIEGAARYAAEHGSWSLRLEPRNIATSRLGIDSDDLIRRQTCDSCPVQPDIEAAQINSIHPAQLPLGFDLGVMKEETIVRNRVRFLAARGSTCGLPTAILWFFCAQDEPAFHGGARHRYERP